MGQLHGTKVYKFSASFFKQSASTYVHHDASTTTTSMEITATNAITPSKTLLHDSEITESSATSANEVSVGEVAVWPDNWLIDDAGLELPCYRVLRGHSSPGHYHRLHACAKKKIRAGTLSR